MPPGALKGKSIRTLLFKEGDGVHFGRVCLNWGSIYNYSTLVGHIRIVRFFFGLSRWLMILRAETRSTLSESTPHAPFVSFRFGYREGQCQYRGTVCHSRWQSGIGGMSTLASGVGWMHAPQLATSRGYLMRLGGWGMTSGIDTRDKKAGFPGVRSSEICSKWSNLPHTPPHAIFISRTPAPRPAQAS